MKELSKSMKEAHDLLKKMDFPVRIETGEGIQFLTVGAKTKHFLLNVRITMREDEKEVYAVTQVPFKIPEGMMPAAYVVLNEFNSRLAFGCFFISMDMQCVFFRACIPFFGELQEEVLGTLMMSTVVTIDKQMHKFATKFLFDKKFSMENLMKETRPTGEAPGMPPMTLTRPSGATLH